MESTIQLINPQQLTVVTSVLKKQHPKYEPFWQPRHDRGIDAGLVEDIKRNGIIHRPVVVNFDGSTVVVVGNRRARAAVAGGLTQIEVDVLDTLDWKVIRDLQVAENEQREENTLFDKVHNILAYLQLDDKGKPQGMSFADVGTRFNYSHQQIRDLALIGTKAPKWFLQLIDDNKISYTEATKLLKANIKNNGDDKTLKEMVDTHMAATVMSKSGKPIKRSGTKNEAKNKPSPQLVEHWSTSKATPTIFRVVLQALRGDISLAEARQIGNGQLDWMVPKPKKEKAAATKKEDKKQKETASDADLLAASGETVEETSNFDGIFEE